MKIISIATASILILSACSSHKVGVAKNGETRAPSSSMDAENLDISFNSILESANPAEEMNAHLDRLKAIYYRAELSVQKFDQRLEDKSKGETDMMGTEEYRDAIAVWALKDRMSDKIQYIYQRLYQMRYGAESNSEQKEAAKKVLISFHNDLRSPIESDRVIYHDLIMGLTEVAKDFRKSNKGAENPVNPGFKNSSDLVNSVIRTRPSFIKLAEESMKNGDPLAADLANIKAEIPDFSEATRAPNSMNVYPSPGSAGNMNGSNFPVGTWALTYDDGPSKKYTPSILQNLKNNGVKATFFWLAQNVKMFPTIVSAVKDGGMLLANHSYSHANLPKLGSSGLDKEINQSTAAETSAYGYKPKFFRCPYGACNSKIRQMIADQGMIHVFWNVDTLDWQDKNPNSVLARTEKQMAANKRGIVLFHDIHSQSMEASRMLVEKTRRTLRWVTMQEIVDQLNGN